MLRRLTLLAALLAPLCLVPQARAQAETDTSAAAAPRLAPLVVPPGGAVYVHPSVSGVTAVRRRIQAIGGRAPAPYVVVVPPATGGAPTVTGGGTDPALAAYLRRLENRIADLDRTIRLRDRGGAPTVVVLPSDADAATIQAYRDSLAALEGVEVVMPSTVRELPPARTPEVAGRPRVFMQPSREDVERALLGEGLLRVAEVNFEFDESDLLPAARRTLDVVGEVLAANSGLRVVIGGHTDAVGTDAYNQALSERRAQSVRSYLLGAFDIAPNRLETRGYGESQPIATNENPTGRTLNRRVEFQVME